jgi:hypothetical protein
MVIRDSVVNSRRYRIERPVAINPTVARKRRAICPEKRRPHPEAGATWLRLESVKPRAAGMAGGTIDVDALAQSSNVNPGTLDGSPCESHGALAAPARALAIFGNYLQSGVCAGREPESSKNNEDSSARLMHLFA